MRILINFLAILLLLVLQAGVLIPLGLMPVNLLLIFVVAAMLVSDFDLSFYLAIASGVILDLSSGTADGLITISFVSTFLIIYFFLNSWVSREPNRLMLFSTVLVSTVLYFLVFLVFNRIFDIFHLGQLVDLEYFFSYELPIMLILNIVFTYPVFLFFTYVQSIRKYKPRQI